MNNNNNENYQELPLINDNSTYFAQWGSRNPMTTINEEIDNQIAAMPKNAGLTIVEQPCYCNIETYNDGNTISPERMEKMNCIGKKYSDRKGASICGVGQIEGLISGRVNSMGRSTLDIRSVKNWKERRFSVIADGRSNTITTHLYDTENVYEEDLVSKSYENMKKLTDKEKKYLKPYIEAKIYPYCAKNNCEYKLNGENIEPYSLFYEGIDSPLIKRMEMKEYNGTYGGQEFKYWAEAIDVSRYIKDRKKADKFHIINCFGPASDGIFVEVDGSYTIMGGRESWKIIGMNHHTTLNGMRVLIKIPSDSILKDIIFGESPKKSETNINLASIKWGEKSIFNEFLEDINKYINRWKNEREILTSDGRIINKNENKKILERIYNNDDFVKNISFALKCLNEEEQEVVKTKKMSAIFSKVLSKKNKELNLNFK